MKYLPECISELRWIEGMNKMLENVGKCPSQFLRARGNVSQSTVYPTNSPKPKYVQLIRHRKAENPHN